MSWMSFYCKNVILNNRAFEKCKLSIKLWSYMTRNFMRIFPYLHNMSEEQNYSIYNMENSLQYITNGVCVFVYWFRDETVVRFLHNMFVLRSLVCSTCVCVHFLPMCYFSSIIGILFEFFNSISKPKHGDFDVVFYLVYWSITEILFFSQNTNKCNCFISIKLIVELLNTVKL